jgi:maltose O-acetyltransferase
VKNIVKRINGEVLTSTLVKRGMRVGNNFNRQQGSYIDPTHCFLIEIGNNVTFSIRVTVLAHDASTKKSTGYTKIGKVIIGDNVFVGANATILPNVKIGDNSIIGANSVVTKDIPANCVAAGNPVKIICSLEEFLNRNQEKMETAQKFGREYRFSKKITEEKKEEMKCAVKNGMAYID